MLWHIPVTSSGESTIEEEVLFNLDDIKEIEAQGEANVIETQGEANVLRSMLMFITSKGKEDYLTDSTKTQLDDSKFKTWKAKNQMVVSRLINSMDIEVGQNFMFYATAIEIKSAAKEFYSDVENTNE
ncbi:UBN2_3 domain-containing protein [Senna tora]|uniref:UBN2_3 domain-containing protein n=1 Tax=Senna tora TaxID=362788 RepID=A0A834SVY8_9FABA|nr:UBN2_3 domain-containing protein [Senna tora]